jgi:pantoate--beta-alanine ligase
MSSRNRYLSPMHRTQAATIYKALRMGEDQIQRGIKDGGKVVEAIMAILHQVSGIEIQYVSIVDAESLQTKDPVAGKVLVAVAVRIGSTRLIDNIVVDAG